MLAGMDTLTASALLARTPSLTADHVRALVGAAGSLEQAMASRLRSLKVDLPASARAFLMAPDEASVESDLRWAQATGAHVIPCTSAKYPPLLAQISGAPPVLYVLGDPEVLLMPQLAMVGARNPTSGGRATAKEFAAFFARSGLTITSGLAMGIDAASHEGALQVDGLTVAICAGGLDRIYPRENIGLAERIREHGALVSEFPPHVEPRRGHFPKRNRIISGLSLGTLVVEAARDSGSLITARHALEQGREVFAIPGSIHNPMARGCHKLIREGAKLVESAHDVIPDLPISLHTQALAPVESAPPQGPGKAVALDKEYEILLDALGFEPTGIDALAERTGLPGESVASMLLILELEGRVAPHPGGLYSGSRAPS